MGQNAANPPFLLIHPVYIIYIYVAYECIHIVCVYVRMSLNYPYRSLFVCNRSKYKRKLKSFQNWQFKRNIYHIKLRETVVALRAALLPWCPASPACHWWPWSRGEGPDRCRVSSPPGPVGFPRHGTGKLPPALQQAEPYTAQQGSRFGSIHRQRSKKTGIQRTNYTNEL